MEPRQLSNKEAEIFDLSLEIINEGYTPAQAAPLALSALPSPDPSFVNWLATQGS